MANIIHNSLAPDSSRPLVHLMKRKKARLLEMAEYLRIPVMKKATKKDIALLLTTDDIS